MDDKPRKPLDEVFAEVFDSLMKGIHTIAIGQVEAFNEELNTVDVQPAIMRKYEYEEEARPITLLKKVPCVFPGDGEFFLTFKPKKGATCILLINSRSLDVWKLNGGIVDPGMGRKFDLSDAIALVGLNPFPNAIPVINEGIALRNKDLSTFVQVLDEEVKVKAPKDIVLENDSGFARLNADGSFNVNGNLEVLV
jgi:hypothetical protein